MQGELVIVVVESPEVQYEVSGTMSVPAAMFLLGLGLLLVAGQLRRKER